MSRRRISSLLLIVMMVICASGSSAAEIAIDPTVLARRIDERLVAIWSAEKITPAPRADDAEFLRRAYLDLTGRIPRAADFHEFMADRSENKREALIDRLLAHPRFAIHQANLWRAELIPETTTDRQAALLQTGFENWIVKRFRAHVRYDEFVRQLIAVRLPSDKEAAEPVLRDPERPNPLAFLAAKNAKPENLAAAVTRSFLGLRLECAECHNHPFASWTQAQFWQQAAFFGGLTKQGDGLFAPLNEDRQRRDVTAEQQHKTYPARWLDGKEPAWSAERSSRDYLADWTVSGDNPYFAKAGANRLWGQFFGVGLVEPVDDFNEANPPSDPELLELLSDAFAASGFDLHYMIRAICRTEAYGRTSARTDASQDQTRLPARMIVKALSGEQFVDSLVLITGYRDEQDKGGARRQFLSRFARGSSLSEPETSVQQALTLLNGPFIQAAVDVEKSPTLIAITQTPGMSVEQRIEALYVTILCRLPTNAERGRLHELLSGDAAKTNQRYGDILWLLLNSAEFRLNH